MMHFSWMDFEIHAAQRMHAGKTLVNLPKL